MDANWLLRWAPGAHRAYLESNTDGGLLAEARRRALAEKVQLRDLAPKVGQAWFPLVVGKQRLGPGRVQGVLARVSVGGQGTPLPVGQAQAVRRWVADWAGRPDTAGLERYALRVDHVPPNWSIEGGSLTFAAAVALLSACLNQPVRGPWVLSGRVLPNRELDSVGHGEAKRSICGVEAPGAYVFIADSKGSPAAQLDTLFGIGWRARLSVALGVSVKRLAHEAWESYQRRNYEQAETQASAALAEADGFAGAIARWVAGACRMHRGDPSALGMLEEALAWFRANPPPDRFQAEELTAFLAIALLDHGRPEAAVDLLHGSMAVLQAVAPSGRDRRWQRVVVQVAGSLRRALLACDRLDEAIATQREWTLGATPWAEDQRARSLQDLGATLLQNGQRDEAVAVLRQARASLVDAAVSERSHTERFVVVQEIRAGLASATYPVAPPDFRQWPQPLEVFESLMAQPAPGDFDAYVAANWIPDGLDRQTLDIGLYAAARATARWGPRPWTTGLLERLNALEEQGIPVSPALRRAVQGLVGGKPEALVRIAAY